MFRKRPLRSFRCELVSHFIFRDSAISGNPHRDNGYSLIQFNTNIVPEQLCLGTDSGGVTLECVKDALTVCKPKNKAVSCEIRKVLKSIACCSNLSVIGRECRS